MPSQTPKRFKWLLVLIPLVIIAGLWLSKGMEPAQTWDQFMTRIGIKNRERYTELAVIGVLCVGVVAVIKVLRSSENENGK